MTTKPRLSVTLEPELMEQIEAYRHQHKISSQSKAILRLVRIGINSLANEGKPIPESEDGLESQERELIDSVRELDPAQRAALLRILDIAGGTEGKQQSQ